MPPYRIIYDLAEDRLVILRVWHSRHRQQNVAVRERPCGDDQTCRPRRLQRPRLSVDIPKKADVYYPVF